MRRSNLAVALRGAGGGSSSQQPRSPIEAPDSLRSTEYARILDLVSEGEIYGFANQGAPLTCAFFNETPVANDDGSMNFKNFELQSRVGTQTQDYISGFGGVEAESTVGVELLYVTPWTRTFTNLNINSIRVRMSTPAMSQTNTSNGDISGTRVDYKIELQTDGGAFVEMLRTSFSGKTSSKYVRSHLIELPLASTGWVVRVTRLTGDSATATLQNRTFIEGFTEIIDAKFRMPMSALVSVVIDAEQFSNIPSRAYHLKGRLIKIPTNYDPVTRVYTGVWDGTFQVQYCNNPAWVFYDMVTNARYGLGHLVSAELDRQVGAVQDRNVLRCHGG